MQEHVCKALNTNYSEWPEESSHYSFLQWFFLFQHKPSTWTFCTSSGNLQIRSLSDTVRKKDLVVSEYLTTLLVFVSRSVTHYVVCMTYSTHTYSWVCIYCVFLMFTCIFIHRRSYLQWERTYECLSDLVVPRSSRWVTPIHPSLKTCSPVDPRAAWTGHSSHRCSVTGER